MTPALLTRPSSPPIASLAPSTRAFAWLSSEMSASIATALPPSPSIFATSSSRRSLRRGAAGAARPPPALALRGALGGALLGAGADGAAAPRAREGERGPLADARRPAGDEDLSAV